MKTAAVAAADITSNLKISHFHIFYIKFKGQEGMHPAMNFYVTLGYLIAYFQPLSYSHPLVFSYSKNERNGCRTPAAIFPVCFIHIILGIIYIYI